jgi:hypothetical protein
VEGLRRVLAHADFFLEALVAGIPGGAGGLGLCVGFRGGGPDLHQVVVHGDAGGSLLLAVRGLPLGGQLLKERLQGVPIAWRVVVLAEGTQARNARYPRSFQRPTAVADPPARNAGAKRLLTTAIYCRQIVQKIQ